MKKIQWSANLPLPFLDSNKYGALDQLEISYTRTPQILTRSDCQRRLKERTPSCLVSDMVPRTILRYFINASIIIGTVFSEEPILSEVSYKATTDYVFQSTLRPDVLYNPRYLEVVKKIDLSPLARSVALIWDLLRSFNESCHETRLWLSAQSNKPRIVRVPGKKLSVTDGVHLCNNFGEGYKLLELRRKEDVTALMSHAPEGRHSTPAAIFYDLRQHKFVYLSSHRPVTRKSAINKFEHGDTIDSYDYWDSYQDYFGQYIIDNSQVYINVVPSETHYDHVYCIAPKRGIERKEEFSSCQQDLKFITDVSKTTIGRVTRLNNFLANTWRSRPKKMEVSADRGKRGITAGAIMSAAIGGAVGVVTTKLISAADPDNDLLEAISKTEEVLDALGERTNLLDINQQRIMLLIEENQRRVNELVARQSSRGQRNLIHSQINSLLIHVKDHLDYLGYILSSKETGAYNLALDDQERTYILRSMTNGSQLWVGTRRSVLDYRIKMLGQQDLCLVIDVPLAPPLRSESLVRAFAFPTIGLEKLMSPTEVPLPFLQFQGAFFVRLDLPTFRECMDTGICSGPWVPEIADGRVNCAISQFFNNASAKCPRKEIEERRKILYAGSMLFFTTLDSMRVKLRCEDRKLDRVTEVRGKGVLETPSSCKMYSNKAIFSDPKPSRILLLANKTLGPEIQIRNIRISNQKIKGWDGHIEGTSQAKLNLVGIPQIPDKWGNTALRYLERWLKRILNWLILLICISGLLVGIYLISRRRNRRHPAIDI